MSQVVARLGKPHGIRGEMTVEVRTDDPEDRFTPGSVFGTEPDIGPLTLTRARWHRDRLLLTFEEVTDRTRAEDIRNTLITAPSADTDAESDAWYIDDLIGAEVVATTSGTPLGTVTAITPGAAQDLIHVELYGGKEVLIPFVEEIVPVVDVDNKRIEIDPPAGLLDM